MGWLAITHIWGDWLSLIYGVIGYHSYMGWLAITHIWGDWLSLIYGVIGWLGITLMIESSLLKTRIRLLQCYDWKPTALCVSRNGSLQSLSITPYMVWIIIFLYGVIGYHSYMGWLAITHIWGDWLSLIYGVIGYHSYMGWLAITHIWGDWVSLIYGVIGYHSYMGWLGIMWLFQRVTW